MTLPDRGEVVERLKAELDGLGHQLRHEHTPYGEADFERLAKNVRQAIALLFNSSTPGEGGLSVPGVAQLDEGPQPRHPIAHTLKCWPPYFADVLDGLKTFEVRKNDRDFRVGDTLDLVEYDMNDGAEHGLHHTGRSCFRTIRYVLGGGQFGVEPGFVVLGLERAPLPASVQGTERSEVPGTQPNPGPQLGSDQGWRERVIAAIEGARLPAGYQWGHDAMEQFNFGKKRAADAVSALFEVPPPQSGDRT